MPAAEVLLDTNVLVYALSADPAERAKHERATELLAVEDFGTSYQIIMETWVAATRKMERPQSAARVTVFLEQLLQFPFVLGTEGLYHQAFQLSDRYKIHPYDAAVLAAAQELGATTIYSEDLGHGQDYDGVRVINPFLAASR